ncbi:MAG: hypothetical protein K8T20_12920 [Planctomycetes bacterium]|nr:hypothetical protein [Planctomycetota bacterium]
MSHDELSVEAFFHFPTLVVPERGVEVLGGMLERFQFEDFEAMDPDWARASYFERTMPSVWRCSCPGELDLNDDASVDLCVNSATRPWDMLESTATLIYFALLVEGPRALPDPRLSVSYARDGKLTRRRIGVYERTFLLNGVRDDVLGEAQLASVAARVAAWAGGKLSPRAKVFGPLRGLALLASGAVQPLLGVAPLIVSLEGYLLGCKIAGGIPAALGRRLRALLGDSAPEDLDRNVSRLYAWRSEIVHGREITDPNLFDLLQWLCRLTRVVVERGAQRALHARSDGNDLGLVRPEEPDALS